MAHLAERMQENGVDQKKEASCAEGRAGTATWRGVQGDESGNKKPPAGAPHRLVVSLRAASGDNAACFVEEDALEIHFEGLGVGGFV